MNININTLFLLLFLVLGFLINIFGLTCYQCADDKGDNCGDTFSVNGSTIVEVNSTSKFCWKLKVDFGSHLRVIRDGDDLESRYSGIYCPKMNTCSTDKAVGVQSTRCCCRDKDFCNTASTASVTHCILLLSAIFTGVFAYMN